MDVIFNVFSLCSAREPCKKIHSRNSRRTLRRKSSWNTLVSRSTRLKIKDAMQGGIGHKDRWKYDMSQKLTHRDKRHAMEFRMESHSSRMHETQQVGNRQTRIAKFLRPRYARLRGSESNGDKKRRCRRATGEGTEMAARMHGGLNRFVEKFADQIAYLRVHSRAVASYRGRSVL